jgi:SAM-dependent methyltransferase
MIPSVLVVRVRLLLDQERAVVESRRPELATVAQAMNTTSSPRHPAFARFFDRVGARDEERGQADLRRELLDGLTGNVLEVGAGTGLNFRHYPSTVTQLVAVEPEPYLRQRAIHAGGWAPVPVHVLAGVADLLPLADASFGAVVVSGVLCSVPEPAAALAEFRRVLRPAGELRFYEHVYAGSPIRRGYQNAIDLVWPHVMGECHVNRDTRQAIEDAGFLIAACRALIFPPDAHLLPVAPRILGRARMSQGGR